MKDAQIAIPTEDGRIYYDMTGTNNPCNGCNACCRHFRVSFYHGELDTQPGGHVPADMTTQITPFRACMKGTESGHGHCIALQSDGRCSIYEHRPSVCREFPVFMEDGSMNQDCTRLREMEGIGVPLQGEKIPEEAIAELEEKLQETLCEAAP